LLYAAEGGDRGQLLAESTWDGTVGYSFDARSNSLAVTRARGPRDGDRPRPHPRGSVPPELFPGEDPGVQLKRLQEQGRLTLAGVEDVRGRRAYRLVSDTWVDPDEKGHTERVEFLVDAESYLPVEQRNISTQLGVSGLPEELRPAPELYATPVTTKATREFLTYEKLPLTDENMTKLEPRPHPGAKVFDPDAPPLEDPGTP
jgi:YD repeat-containing protein